ncbi:MAG: hypothetical protein ACR2PW_04670 [Gammaproteobacteria bacterium]
MSKRWTLNGVEYTQEDCLTCGIVYFIPTKMRDEQQRTGGEHYCPNGHTQGWYKGGTEFDKLQRERDRLKQRQAQLKDELQSAERQVAAQKANVTKLKKRAGAGICPCCNRQFANLKRHMSAKHPDYADTVRKEPLKVVEGGKS